VTYFTGTRWFSKGGFASYNHRQTCATEAQLRYRAGIT
jgi:hypothetical protein